MLPCRSKNINLNNSALRAVVVISIFIFLATIISHVHSTLYRAKSYDAYLILFPSNGNKIFLVKDETSSFWELPGGKAIWEDIETWDEFFTTLKRNWKNDVGVELPWLNPFRKFNSKKGLYYVAKTSGMLQLPNFLPENGNMDYWKLVSVEDILKEPLREDHKKALEKAIQRGYINHNGMQL